MVSTNPGPSADRRVRIGRPALGRRIAAFQSEVGGYRSVGTLRIAAAVAVAIYVLAFSAFDPLTVPGHVSPVALGLCGYLAVIGVGQARAWIGGTRRSAAVILTVDFAVFLGSAGALRRPATPATTSSRPNHPTGSCSSTAWPWP